MSQISMVKLFDRHVRRLGHSKAHFPLNFTNFEVPIRRSPWFSRRSFQIASFQAKFERSSAILAFILSRTQSFHFTEGLGYQSIFGANLRRFRYWQLPKYEGWFLYYDCENFVTPNLHQFHQKPTKDQFAYLSNDEVNCPCQINFCDTPVKHPEEYLKELNPLPSANPPKFVTFKILNRQVP